MQIEQLESVLNEKQAFFFSNWIFEYNQNTLKEILKNEEEELTTEGKVFGKPEKELIKSLLAEIEIENVGFYLDAKGRLCGAQTLRLSNASKVITMANKVLGRQLKARLPEMKNFSPETITLIREEIEGRFSVHPTQWKSASSLYDYEPCRSGKILRELTHPITRWNPY